MVAGQADLSSDTSDVLAPPLLFVTCRNDMVGNGTPNRELPEHQNGRVMQPKLLIVNEDTAEREALCALLAKEGYLAEVVTILDELESRMGTGDYLAVLLDVDSVQVENRTIRDWVLANPGIPFLCTSQDRFHPKLKDAICYHIFACINKPVDPDELRYWLRCIREDQNHVE